MGFVQNERSGSTGMVYVSKGKFVTYEDGKRNERDMALRGFVLGFDFDLENYQGKEYEVIDLYLRDSENDSFTLRFPLESGYGASFCKMAKNVDWSKPLEFSVSVKKENGKDYGSLFVKQPDENGKWNNLKWAYTEKEPGKMPPPEKKSDRNGEYNDYTKRNKFFREMLLKLVAPALKKLHPNFDPAKAKADAKKDAPAPAEPIDDLPF